MSGAIILFLFLLNIAIVLLGEAIVGLAVLRVLARRFGFENPEEILKDSPFRSAAIVLGILIHLTFVLFFGGALCSVSWIKGTALLFPRLFWGIISISLPLFALACEWRQVKRILCSIRPSISYAVFFCGVFFLGLSLFDVGEEITTPWVFNYGDLPFHLGMITNFFWGANLFPEYQIYAGKQLSYPFFVNLWSVTFWWPKPDLEALDFVFAIQWTVLWSVVFIAVRGERYPLLPWALLLGGGSFDALARLITDTDVDLKGVFAGKIDRAQIPWETLLTTIWVTQRSAIFGMATLLCAVRLFHERWSFSGNDRVSRLALFLSGAVLSGTVLVHTHSFVVGVLYVVSLLGILALDRLTYLIRARTLTKARLLEIVRWPFFAALALAPSLIYFPFVWGKRSTLKIQFGWMPWAVTTTDGLPLRLVGSIAMWATAFCFVIPVVVWWAVSLKRNANFAALAVLFLFGNIVIMSIWEWDQIKYFIALYGVFLSLVGSYGMNRTLFAQFTLVLLIIPGNAQLIKFLSIDNAHAIFNREDREVAEQIMSNTDACAVILAKNDHNNAVMLTGRRLYAGYAGWIWTHAIDAERRDDVLNKMTLPEMIARVRSEKGIGHCGIYILNTKREEARWKASDLMSIPDVTPTGSKYLFRVF